MNRCRSILIKTSNRLTNNRGTTLVEYGLILLLVAIVVILGIKMVGESTNKLYSITNSEITKAGTK